jgi:hypothetical protein
MLEATGRTGSDTTPTLRRLTTSTGFQSEVTMKKFTVIGSFTVLLIASITGSFALVQSADASSTVRVSAHDSNMSATTISGQQSIGTLVSVVGPDWAAKLPSVKDAISREVAAHLKNNYARGNRRDAWVEALEARGSRLYMRAKVRHHHVTRVFRRDVTAYSVTNTIETTFDPLNPSGTMDQSRMCFDYPRVVGGRACVSARDVVRIITAGL